MWDFVRKARKTNIAFQGGRTTSLDDLRILGRRALPLPPYVTSCKTALAVVL